MPRRKERKNPLPQRLLQEIGQENVLDSESTRKVFIYPDPNLKLPQESDQMLEILNQTPITSLYRENGIGEINLASTFEENRKLFCPNCGEEYGTSRDLRHHQSTTCPKFTCLICGESFPKLEEVTNHISDLHLNPEDDNEEDVRATRSGRKSTNSLLFHDDGDNFSGEEYIQHQTPEKSYWPKTRKRKKIKDVGGRGALSFAKLNQPLGEVMPWVHEQLKLLEAAPKLSSLLMPKFQDYEVSVSLKELIGCIPISTTSPSFQIVNETYGLSIECPGLESFTALPSDYTSKRLDWTFFASGPIRALAWCPASLCQAFSRQYIALSTHFDLHSIVSRYSEPGIIQIWDCGTLNIHGHQNEVPKFSLGLSHNEGPIWQLKWCPIGGRISPSQQNSNWAMERLGVIAAACGSGKVLLIPIPDPDEIQLQSVSSSGETEKIFRVKPALILIPCSSILNKEETGNGEPIFAQCLCVDWNIASGCQFVCAGFSCGLVAIWKVFKPSPLLISQTGDSEPPILLPICTFRAHTKAVRGIGWCPFDENVLATAGMDRYLRIWDRRNIECPLKESNWKGSIYTELHWPSIWCGVYTATDEVFAGPCYHGALYHDALHRNMNPTAVIPFKTVCWSVSASEWVNCLVGCDAMGQTVVHACSNWNRHMQCKKFVPRIRIFSTNVEWITQPKQKDSSKMKHANGEAFLKTPNFDEYKLIFHDSDMSDLEKCTSRDCCQDVKLYDSFPATCCDNPLVQSVNRVAWNPNFGSHTWIASGTQSGLVRLHCVDAMHSKQMDKFFDENYESD